MGNERHEYNFQLDTKNIYLCKYLEKYLVFMILKNVI